MLEHRALSHAAHGQRVDFVANSGIAEHETAVADGDEAQHTAAVVVIQAAVNGVAGVVHRHRKVGGHAFRVVGTNVGVLGRAAVAEDCRMVVCDAIDVSVRSGAGVGGHVGVAADHHATPAGRFGEAVIPFRTVRIVVTVGQRRRGADADGGRGAGRAGEGFRDGVEAAGNIAVVDGGEDDRIVSGAVGDDLSTTGGHEGTRLGSETRHHGGDTANDGAGLNGERGAIGDEDDATQDVHVVTCPARVGGDLVAIDDAGGGVVGAVGLANVDESRLGGSVERKRGEEYRETLFEEFHGIKSG